MSSTPNLESVDHIMMLSPSVSVASEYILEKTGVEPVYGGEHEGMGSCNYLISLGNGQYLEILAPVASSPQPGEHDIVKVCRTLQQPQPFMVCMAAEDLNNVAAVLADHEIDAVGPEDWQRRRPDGEMMVWQLVTCFGNRFGPVFPFFIKWGDCEHPATTSPGGCSLKNLVVQHPQHAEMAAIFDALDLAVPVQEASEPGLKMVLSTPQGEVEF